MFFLLLFLLFLTLPKTTYAQIPLFHQLVQAYQPRHLPSISKQLSLSTPPTTPQTGKILGLSTTPTKSLTEPSSLTATSAIGTPLEPEESIGAPSPQNQNIGGEGKVITIALLGDSMIDTIKESTLEASLKKYFPNRIFNILNYGLGASDIEYGLYRLRNNYQNHDQVYPSLISQKPDIIIIESFAYNNFGNNQSGIDRQWLAMGAITTEIKKTLPDTQIILATTITPNSVSFGNGSPFEFTSLEKIEKTSTIKLYLQNIINFATSQNFPLADSYTPSLTNDQGNPDFISATDNIHPSQLGTEFFCDTIAQTISRYKILKQIAKSPSLH